MRIILTLTIAIAVALLADPSDGLAAGPKHQPPYPRSPVIRDVTWDVGSRVRRAQGSDLWPVTWADDGNLYTGWGDGGGFGGTNSKGRVSIGVGRIKGPANAWKGINLWGGFAPLSAQQPTTGKCNGGILCVKGTLYLFVTEQGRWMRAKLWTSADHGLSWQDKGWIFDEPGGVFGAPGLVQFGKDYEGARDRFVYGYSESERRKIQPHLDLFRVPKDRLAQRKAYEFFAGLDSARKPIWKRDVRQRKPVFSDPAGLDWGVNAAYHPILKRYLLTVRHKRNGSWGIFDAPEPWGPWTTVAQYNNWLPGVGSQITYILPTKWMGADGKTLWMIVSAGDCINVIKGHIEPVPDGPLHPKPG